MSHPWVGPGDIKLAIDTYRHFRDLIRDGPGRYDEAVRVSESMRHNFERLEEMYSMEGSREAFEAGMRVGEMGPTFRGLARLSQNPPRSDWQYAFSHSNQKKMRELTENLRTQREELREYMGTIDSQNMHHIMHKVDRIDEVFSGSPPLERDPHPHHHHHHHHHHGRREIDHHHRV